MSVGTVTECQHAHSTRDECQRKWRAPEFSHWSDPTCTVFPLVPSHELSIMAAEVRTTNANESPLANFAIARRGRRWRVSANDKITSETYGGAHSTFALISDSTDRYSLEPRKNR